MAVTSCLFTELRGVTAAAVPGRRGGVQTLDGHGFALRRTTSGGKDENTESGSLPGN